MPYPRFQAPPEAVERLKALQAREKELEAKKLAKIDVFAKIGYEPNCKRRYKVRKAAAKELGLEDPFDARVTNSADLPEPCGKCPQEQFHSATEDDVLYGGAAGGGKSIALVAEGLKACARYPGIRVLLLRRSYDELEESVFPALRKLGMGKQLGARWNGAKHQLTFPNGSLFRFRYLERVEDAARRQGGEYQLLLIDELTLMAPGLVDFLRFERIRSGLSGVPVIGIRATSNPGGVGHGEVKKRYIEGTGTGAHVAKDEHGMSVRFIPAKVDDNPRVDAGYAARLDAIPDPARRAAMRDGDWDQFAGQMFPEFSDTWHMLDPIALPASWRRYNGVDWGFAAPWAVLWGAVDEDGRVWIYRELYQTQVGEADQARMILEAEAGEHVIARWADDAMWATRGDAKPIAHVYADNGVHLTPAGKGPGSRIQGWQRWHSFMKDMPACAHHRAAGQETCPRVHVFTTCPNLRAELKALPHATSGDPEDADPKAPDHACLVAGTLVETTTGPRPIERIRGGDYVLTRSGPRRVLGRRPYGALGSRVDGSAVRWHAPPGDCEPSRLGAGTRLEIVGRSAILGYHFRMSRSESVIFNGITYRRYPDSPNWADRMYYTPGPADKAKGFQRLHQEVWKDAHGAIPPGCDIHHRDENTLNNDPGNLECITEAEHHAHHASHQDLRTPERLAHLEEIRPLAAEWHRSEKGRAWHSEHGRRVAESRRIITQRACEQCGREYETADIATGAPARFCSNNCKSQWRRESGVDNENRNCLFCGAGFEVNKYARKRCCSRSCGAKFSRQQRAA